MLPSSPFDDAPTSLRKSSSDLLFHGWDGTLLAILLLKDDIDSPSKSSRVAFSTHTESCGMSDRSLSICASSSMLQ